MPCRCSAKQRLANSPGQSSLPPSCPVCEHTPVAADDCKPHKSLRTTIKVFLRTEEKKREALRAKAPKETPRATPAADTAAPAPAPVEEAPRSTTEAKAEDQTPAPAAAEPEAAAETPAAPATVEPAPEGEAASNALPNEGQEDVPQQSIEVCVLAWG